MRKRLELRLMPDRLVVCRLDAGDESELKATSGLFSVTRTEDELSVVCAEDDAPPGALAVSGGWRALKVHGPVDHTAVGVLSAIAIPLADAGVPMLPLATFDTDYVLVTDSDLSRATGALESAGHSVESK